MNKIPVALYARYSTDRQDARSIDDQLRRCRRFADEHGYGVRIEFTDAAQSGASIHRAGMQRLLAEARRGHRCTFRAVLVDDLSRLSRDLGDTWRIVFEDLASADVRVIDCTTGLASNATGARLTFGATALVNDYFLELVRTETHRGLEGRAEKGFWAGGTCYGFRTEPEPDPEDPKRPRAVIRHDEHKADVVRRIWREYGDGKSLKTILAALNREGVPAPLDGYSKKKVGRGWSKSLLYAMLRNERYLGRFVWNKRQWYRDPVTKRRRYRLRPSSEWITVEMPELAIVDEEVALRVQERHAARRGKSASPPVRRHEHMLSGQLVCGACGSPMSIVSRAHKNGRSWSNFGCSARHQKGDELCSNKRTISEIRVDRAVLKALREFAESPEFERWIEAGVAEAERWRRSETDEETAQLRRQVAAQERQVAKVADTLLEVGVSEALKNRLHEEEVRLRQLRAALAAALPRRSSSPTPRVSREKVVALVQDASQIARKAPRRAGAILAGIIEPVVLHPVPEGYRGDVRVRNDSAALRGGRVCDQQSCGGRI